MIFRHGCLWRDGKVYQYLTFFDDPCTVRPGFMKTDFRAYTLHPGKLILSQPKIDLWPEINLSFVHLTDEQCGLRYIRLN